MNKLSISLRYTEPVSFSSEEPGLTAVLFNAGPPGSFILEAFVDSVPAYGPEEVTLNRMETKEIGLCLSPDENWNPKARNIEVVATVDGNEMTRGSCFCDTVPEDWLDSLDNRFASSFCRIVSGYFNVQGHTPDEGDISEIYERLESVSLRDDGSDRYKHVSDPIHLTESGEGTRLDMAAYMLCQLASRGHLCIFVRMPGSFVVGSADPGSPRGYNLSAIKDTFKFIDPSKASSGVPYMVCRDLTTDKVRTFLPRALRGRDWDELRHARRTVVTNLSPIVMRHPYPNWAI